VYGSYSPLIAVTKMLDMGDCSIMLSKFRDLAQKEKLYYESAAPIPPKFYFFYSTLMDPDQLAKVLQLGDTEQPVTRPASIAGYSCKMSGAYPSIVDGPSPESIVHGVVLEVTSLLVVRRIAEYQSFSYVKHDCIIRFEGGESLSGVTFKWRGPAEDLQEGSFDLREWQSKKKQ
jgi:hypothetical protein